MRRPRLVAYHATSLLFLAALLCAPAWGANPAQPGAVNYVEGQVSIGAQHLDHSAVGSAVLDTGQTLTTGNGKAEVLLTPGVFLRLDDQSAATMVSPGLTDTEIRLEKGRSLIEVDEIHKENNLRIAEDGTSARLMKNGLYDFNADLGTVRVFDGQAVIQSDDRGINLKGGHELLLTASVTPRKFDKDSARDTFYNWSRLRSDYLAEANADAARYYYRGGMAWPTVGWYWDPWYGAYTFLPGSGLLYSPFGWAYYSPWWGADVPLLYLGRTFHHFDGHFHGHATLVPSGRGFVPSIGHFAPAVRNGGFHWGGFPGHGPRR